MKRYWAYIKDIGIVIYSASSPEEAFSMAAAEYGEARVYRVREVGNG